MGRIKAEQVFYNEEGLPWVFRWFVHPIGHLPRTLTHEAGIRIYNDPGLAVEGHPEYVILSTTETDDPHNLRSTLFSRHSHALGILKPLIIGDKINEVEALKSKGYENASEDAGIPFEVSVSLPGMAARALSRIRGRDLEARLNISWYKPITEYPYSQEIEEKQAA